MVGTDTDITERKRAEEALRERARLAGFTAEVSLTLNRDISMETMLRQCMEAAVCHLDASLARVWTLGPGDLCQNCFKAAWCSDRTQCLHLVASAGLSTNLDGEYRRVPLGALKIGRIAQGMGAMFTNDALADDRLPNKDWLRAQGLRSFAGFPLIIEDNVFGVMALFAKAPLSDPTLQTLESACNGIAAAIARKQSSERLRASEERFRKIFEGAPIGMATAGRDYRFTRVNQALCDMLGYTREELTGKTFLEITHPEDRELGMRDVRRLIAGEINSFELDKRYLRKDRSAVQAHLIVTGIRDGDGKHLYNLAMIEDITDRKRAEEALAASEKRLRTILEAEPECVKVTTEDGILLDINAAGLAMIEADSLEQVIGQSVCPLIAPDYRDAFAEFTRRVCRGEPGTMQFELIGLKGTHRWMDTHAVPLRDESNDTIGVLAITRDITERKQAERVRERLVAELAESRSRFEMFFRETPSAIAITTVNEGRFLDVNKQAEVLTGYSREELLGRTTVEMNLYVEPADRPQLMTKLKETGVLANLERQIRTKSGEIRTAIFSLVPILMGAEPCLLSIAHDITERKRAEEGLRERSRQQAIEAELSRAAVTSQTLPDLLGTAVTLVSNALAVDYCEVQELLSNGADARLCASAGWRGHRIGQVRAVEPGSLAQAALQSNKPVVRTLSDDTRFSGPPWMRRHGAVGGMSVAIRGKEAPWGILAAYAAGERAFSRDDVNFLQTVASILATAIERMQAESVLRNANQALRLLSRQLLQIQEDERRAIARDLHDEIGQSLTAIKLNVERAQRTSDHDTRNKIMKDCLQITDGVLNQVRNLSLDLHPSILDDLGLTYALKWYAGRQAERAGLPIEVTADPSLPRLSPDIEVACFRIAQEALTNVVRHAHAGRAGITLKRGAAAVELSIQDDGIGFVVGKASPASTGLASMQERAKLLGGTVQIASAPRRGTKVIATLPLLMATPADAPVEEAPRS
jgi:PAS domain S-box-containing protein